MKKILGLDLGTNSIGWALIDKNIQTILGMNSRVIPMGTDKQDYEKGIGITKNATRREKRTTRKMNKRYKLRRNKLLFILDALGMLPDQFQFKNGLPEPKKLQELELLPIKRGTLQLDSLEQYELCVKALKDKVELKEFGKILYKFNQLRGYSGGNNDDDTKKKQNDESENDDDAKKKTYEVITQKVEILHVKKSDETFTVRGGINKGEKQNYFIITIKLDEEEKEGRTELQNLAEKINQEEELETRIRRNKKTGEETSVVFALPQKSNWRKAMEDAEKKLKEDNLFISELRLMDLQRDLPHSKWTKIRNRVFLRNRYKEEFDKVWETQARYYPILNDCPKEILDKIVNYIFPGESESQQQLRKKAVENGLKYIIKEQIIYYQRPLKPQTELISNCRFEKDEKVAATSNPLFQEFRCWKQINNLYVTSKQEVYSEKKKKNIFQYTDRYLTSEQKQELYNKLQVQKQVGFNEVKKIVGIKDDKTEYLNGLNVKAKLAGCDTLISIKKHLGEYFETIVAQEPKIVEKLWNVIFDIKNHEGSEYETTSKRVSSIVDVLQNYTNKETATELALKLAQSIKFPRKYASLSAKAIQNILPLMQLNPQNVSEPTKAKFKNIKHLVETGEIIDNVDYGLEDYVIDFVKNNPNILDTGGLMEYLAISLIYGKHTAETIKAEIKNYHDIKYEKRNLRNPIVEQLANETMQIVKAIWKQYKINPEELEIRVELARDLKNSAQERKKIFDGQNKNRKANEGIKKRLQEEGVPITDKNILKYRLYVQQKFISPYTRNEIIPFSALFDDRLYDIDHIIPKSRYFDNSISNLVVCETSINEEKSNRTAWEYITQQNSKFEIRSIEEYVDYVNDNFFGKKKKNLLAEKIPTNPVERQLKDTQYISVAIKNELAKIVGSENVKTSTGEVTDFLRSHWGLKDLFMRITKDRFEQMELWDLDENGNPKTKWVEKYVDENGKNIYKIKNWSKRYDHRHHAIDALVVALTEQSHIQRLNNLNKYIQDELTNRKDEFKIAVKDDETILEAFFNLEDKRRDEILRKMESSRKFDTPIPDLVKQVREHLETMVVSIKPKDKLGISVDEFDKNTPDKQLKKQVKIRGALHQETYYGQLNGRDTKRVELSTLSITKNKTTKKEEIVELIDKVLESEIIAHRNASDENGKALFQSTKEAFTGEGLKMFNDKRIASGKQSTYKVKVWYNKEEKKESSLQRLYDNNEKQSVITGDNYLFLIMEKETKTGKERVFDIVSLYDSVKIANDALKDNISDFKKKIAEDYRLSYGERNKIRGKVQENPDRVLFTLQQNELVYLPIDSDDLILRMSNSEFEEWITDKENKKAFCKRMYKVVKFSGKDCSFIPHSYANSISVAKDFSKEDVDKLKEQYGEKKIPKKELNFVEFGSYRDCSPYDSLHKNNKLKIQNTCIKIQIDWLGNIKLV